jgi:precorrin-6B methylase 2
MTRQEPKYIPALSWKVLTPFYDTFFKLTMQEESFKRRLIEQAQIRPGQRVLDLGCGTGTLTVMVKQAQPNSEVTGLDGDLRFWKLRAVKRHRLAGASHLMKAWPINCLIPMPRLIVFFPVWSFII